MNMFQPRFIEQVTVLLRLIYANELCWLVVLYCAPVKKQLETEFLRAQAEQADISRHVYVCDIRKTN